MRLRASLNEIERIHHEHISHEPSITQVRQKRML